MKKVLFLILILFTLTGCNKEETILEPNKVNLNELAISDKVLNDLKFYNTSIIYDQGITTFKTILLNNGADIQINNVNIEFYSKNKTLILKLVKNINKKINKNEKIQIVLATDIDLTDIYEVKYNID